MILWTIIQIDEQCLDMRKALSHHLPPVDQPIHQTIAGDFGRHSVEKDFIGGGEQNAHRGHRSGWLKIMIDGFGWDAVLASTRKKADLDGGRGHPSRSVRPARWRPPPR